MSENIEKHPAGFSTTQDAIVKCVVLSVQQYKSPRYSTYSLLKLTKGLN